LGRGVRVGYTEGLALSEGKAVELRVAPGGLEEGVTDPETHMDTVVEREGVRLVVSDKVPEGDWEPLLV
jgi:uncharacterized protein YabE (DUF348 family)